MLRYSFMLVLATVCASSGVSAQKPTPSKGERMVVTPDGALRFIAPATWHVLRMSDDPDAVRHIFHVRNPATDSGRDRTNVLVVLYKQPVTGDFRAFTDTAFARMREGSEIVLDDHVVHQDRRALFWRGQLGATPYMGFDNFARVDKLWLHVRIVSPLVEGTAAEWSETLSRETERLLATLTLQGRRVMNDSTGFPAISVFSPEAPPNAAWY